MIRYKKLKTSERRPHPTFSRPIDPQVAGRYLSLLCVFAVYCVVCTPSRSYL